MLSSWTFKDKEYSQHKLSADIEQMGKKCSGNGHSHTETTPNEAFSNTQVPFREHYYQTLHLHRTECISIAICLYSPTTEQHR